MDLMHNEVIRIAYGEHKGLYRIVLDERRTNQVVVVRLQAKSEEVIGQKGGGKKLEVTRRPRKRAPPPLVGGLIWLNREDVELLDRERHLLRVEIELDPLFYLPPATEADQEVFESRKEVMKEFLNYKTLRDGILVHAGLGGLVRAAVDSGSASRALVYKLWSLLCRNGFSETSLRPLREYCGAPGVSRPCDPGGRAKAGRKTGKQRIAAKTGIRLAPEQPGMTTEWRNLIMAADLSIPEPKPAMSARCTQILNSHFCKRFRYVNDKLVEVLPGSASKAAKLKKSGAEVIEQEPNKGEYPNRAQIRRVLEVEIPRLKRTAQSTTPGHFKRNLRGLVAKSWQGVAGPGHTWAIDSTIGDIYLRSSLNAAWIIGRPAVYIICDVWSTAIVGYYVCLQGPSWDMAKVALFSAGSDPALIADLWGYQWMETLSPAPTLPAMVLCDRGEYLSHGARLTSMQLSLQLSYTPPYRPDLKGSVEVLHRIMKDHQRCDFVPGAIDARRAEMELRKFNPNDGVFTVRQFVHYLHVIFAEYNLTADREKRLDAHMKAAGVFPSPAGLWAWGHQMGAGYRRAVPQAELINSLLMSDVGRVSRNGVMYAGRHYSNAAIEAQQWTAHARNFGGWDIPCHYYPGSVSRIWTPNISGKGLLDLQLSDQSTASRELTFDEVADAFMYAQLSKADVEHTKTMVALNTRRRVMSLIESSKAEVAAASARNQGAKPSLTEARALEVAAQSAQHHAASPVAPTECDFGEAEQAHLDMMRAIAAAENDGGQDD